MRGFDKKTHLLSSQVWATGMALNSLDKEYRMPNHNVFSCIVDCDNNSSRNIGIRYKRSSSI